MINPVLGKLDYVNADHLNEDGIARLEQLFRHSHIGHIYVGHHCIGYDYIGHNYIVMFNEDGIARLEQLFRHGSCFRAIGHE